MRFILSTIFNLFFFSWTFIVCIICLPLLIFPPNVVILSGRLWANGILIASKLIIGLKFEIYGKENIPKAGCIIASKHQSAFETIIFYLLCDMPAYILKKELKYIPIFGWYISRIKAISVNRIAGVSALKSLVKQACILADNNRQIIIFPEGTRVEYGQKVKYQAGIAAIYLKTSKDIIPVALNSGKFWARNSWIKNKGTIIFKILPPIEKNLSKTEFLIKLEKVIETESNRL